MLKVYNVYDYVSIDGAEWRRVGRSGYKVTDEEIVLKQVDHAHGSPRRLKSLAYALAYTPRATRDDGYFATKIKH